MGWIKLQCGLSGINTNIGDRDNHTWAPDQGNSTLASAIGEVLVTAHALLMLGPRIACILAAAASRGALGPLPALLLLPLLVPGLLGPWLWRRFFGPTLHLLPDHLCKPVNRVLILSYLALLQALGPMLILVLLVPLLGWGWLVLRLDYWLMLGLTESLLAGGGLAGGVGYGRL